MTDYILNGVLGLAVGDALGQPAQGKTRESLLWAVNLGEDADTVAAVAGSLAGLYYGYDSIPHEWLAGLKNKEMIVRVCG